MSDVLTQSNNVGGVAQGTATMKRLEVIIKPGKIDAVKQAIKATGYFGVTVSQVEGHGNQKGLTKKSEDGSYRLEMLPKMRLEIVVPEPSLEPLIQAILKAAWTGKPGDGKIFVSDVRDVIRISSGERGVKAI
jgi:nitrogen regulatory protein P-II 1